MSPAKVMIVEDEALQAADLTDRVEQLGCEVTSVHAYGERALERISEDSPDIVLMDVKLRGAMDGIDAAGQIKEQWGIPIVFLTAFSDSSLLERAKRTEAFGYLIKPVGTPELNCAMEMALHNAKMDSERRALIRDLEGALANARKLDGLLPICSKCKKIRDDDGNWQHVESYISARSEADFTHSICPDCFVDVYPDTPPELRREAYGAPEAE